MDSALAWIGQIAEWFGRLIPRWTIVPATHGAVKFVYGKKIVALGPGIHFWWPAVTEMRPYPTCRQADNLPAQTITTRDGKVIAVSSLIVFEVPDIEALVGHTYNPDNTIQEIALAAMLEVLPVLTWEELRGMERAELDLKLRRAAAKWLKPYGVKVLKMTLVDLAPCRVFRLLSSSRQDEDIT